MLSQAMPTLIVDPTPTHPLSPHLYMQFMEPLGSTDGSVEAGWDFQRETWRQDLVDATRTLGPTLMRWGGCLSSYYRWREGVGPREARRPMHNLLWGGIESNQVGTHEFLQFCRLVGADPLLTINFAADGRRHWAYPRRGGARCGDAAEAAEWVAYCNQRRHPLRVGHGHPEPYGVPLWQIGNETSYDREGFDLETTARLTIQFAEAMHHADPSIRLIGWGDSDWAPRMIEVAGEHLQYLAFHHMWSPDAPKDWDWRYFRREPEHAWALLMEAYRPHQAKIERLVSQVLGSDVDLALTECHLSLPGRNRCEALSTWAAGVAYARVLNVHQRQGERLKIATAADFCGTRWLVNAVMIPTPQGSRAAYLMPVARVMALYRHHTGEEALAVSACPAGLDGVASRTGERCFLHVANTRRDEAVTASLAVADSEIVAGRAFEIAVAPEFEVDAWNAADLEPAERTLDVSQPWHFPPASVTVIELEIATPSDHDQSSR